MELADSFVVDPHKWLFAPFDCAALLYRDPRLARAVHTQDASYLDSSTPDDEWNPTDYAYHLTRRARGLAIWFSLALHGVDAYRDAVESSLALARWTAALIGGRPHLELVRDPDLSIVMFRRTGWDWATTTRGPTSCCADQVALRHTVAGRARPWLRFAFLLARGAAVLAAGQVDCRSACQPSRLGVQASGPSRSTATRLVSHQSSHMRTCSLWAGTHCPGHARHDLPQGRAERRAGRAARMLDGRSRSPRDCQHMTGSGPGAKASAAVRAPAACHPGRSSAVFGWRSGAGCAGPGNGVRGGARPAKRRGVRRPTAGWPKSRPPTTLTISSVSITHLGRPSRPTTWPSRTGPTGHIGSTARITRVRRARRARGRPRPAGAP